MSLVQLLILVISTVNEADIIKGEDHHESCDSLSAQIDDLQRNIEALQSTINNFQSKSNFPRITDCDWSWFQDVISWYLVNSENNEIRREKGVVHDALLNAVEFVRFVCDENRHTVAKNKEALKSLNDKLKSTEPDDLQYIRQLAANLDPIKYMRDDRPKYYKGKFLLKVLHMDGDIDELDHLGDDDDDMM
eukprot:76746_1